MAFAWYLSYGVESIKHAVASERKTNNIKRTAYRYLEHVCDFSRTGDKWCDGEEEYVKSMINHMAENYNDTTIVNMLNTIDKGLSQMTLSKISIIHHAGMIQELLTTTEPKNEYENIG